MKKLLKNLVLLFIIVIISFGTVGCDTTNSPPQDSLTEETDTLMGRLVYHSYDNYGDGSSRLFVFNFTTEKLECISDAWTNVKDPMNAVWTEDGKAIVFMGVNTINPEWEFYAWDIFYYEIGTEGNPRNLTNDNWSRNEDPKMFPGSNNKIIYKSMGLDENYIREIVLYADDIKINTLYSSTEIEPAMPAYSLDGKVIYFSGLLDGEMDIYSTPIQGGQAEKVQFCSEPEIFEYYQIPAKLYDNDGFLYAAHSNSNMADQIYFKSMPLNEPILMPFNIPDYDSADPCVVNQNYTIFSSIRQGGNGSYDLYIGNNITGQVQSLNLYNANINTATKELGAHYTKIIAG